MKRTHSRRLSIEASKLGSAGALLCLASSLAFLGGCSDSSSGAEAGVDGSSPQDGPTSEEAGIDAAADAGPPPIGDPVASCGSCPVCGGALASATTGVSYCTQNCQTDSDCPKGTACMTDPIASALNMQCLKPCQANSDCAGIFICRSDIEDAGNVCWSPYPPPVAPEAGTGGLDSGGADAGPAADASPEAGSDAAFGSDATTDSGLDGGTDKDASDSGGPG